LKRVFSYLIPYWKQLLLTLGCIVAKSRTSILIAHRLSTILSADEILVVQDGRIVERGQHRDLLKNGGVYTRLYETQFQISGGEENEA